MNATLIKEIVIIAAFSILLLIIATILQKRPRSLNNEYFKNKWSDLQKKCAQKDTWALAVIDADKLLDEALKKKHYKGKSMGERLVSAQHELSDNDGVWYGHKLRNQLVHDNIKLTQNKVKEALVGIRQALKDLGAL